VFVLLFGVGEAETEGIYSLRAMSREEGLPQDTIVAFEDLEDAERCVRAVNPPYTHIYVYRVHKPLPRFLWFVTSYVLPVSHAQPLTHPAAMMRVCKWSD
jgi:hypothetical protein